MKLKKDFDNIVVGKNYLSLLISLFLLKRNESVLLVDDKRVSLGRSWGHSFGDIERDFLALMGTELQLEPLIHVDRYLKRKPYLFKLDERSILLGRTPFENLKELMRKIPEGFQKETLELFNENNQADFNRSCEILFHDIAQSCFKITKLTQFDEFTIDSTMNNLYRKITTGFIHSLEKGTEKEKLILKQLLFMFQGKFFYFFTNTYSQFDLKFLFTQMLSPKYELDEEKINHDLEKALAEKKGWLKHTTVQYWQFYEKKLCSILLSSYEGVVHPRKTFFVGNLGNHVPFYYKSKYRKFSDIQLELNYQTPLFKEYEGMEILLSYSKRVGSDFPFWEIQFQSAHSCSFRYLYPKQDGAKPEFYFEQAKSDVLFGLSELFAEFDPAQIEGEIFMGSGGDVWSEVFSYRMGESKQTIIDQLAESPSATLINNEDHEFIKTMDYWGPTKIQPLGLLSFLVDVKNYCL